MNCGQAAIILTSLTPLNSSSLCAVFLFCRSSLISLTVERVARGTQDERSIRDGLHPNRHGIISKQSKPKDHVVFKRCVLIWYYLVKHPSESSFSYRIFVFKINYPQKCIYKCDMFHINLIPFVPSYPPIGRPISDTQTHVGHESINK